MSNMSPDKPPPAGPHSVCLDFGGQTKPHVRSCDSHDFNIDIEIVGDTQNRCQKCGCQICVSQNDSFRETNADVPIVGVLFCGIPVNTIPKASFLPHSHHRVHNRSQQQWWVSWWMIGFFWKSWSCFTLSGWCCSTTQGSSRDSWRQSPCAASPWYQLQLQMPKIRKLTRYPYFLLCLHCQFQFNVHCTYIYLIWVSTNYLHNTSVISTNNCWDKLKAQILNF